MLNRPKEIESRGAEIPEGPGVWGGKSGRSRGLGRFAARGVRHSPLYITESGGASRRRAGDTILCIT